MLYPARCKRITVDQSKVLKKNDCSGFFFFGGGGGGPPGIVSHSAPVPTWYN